MGSDSMCKNNPPADDLAALQVSPRHAKIIACTLFGAVTGYKYLPLVLFAALMKRWRRGAQLWSGFGVKVGMLLSIMSLRTTFHLWRTMPSNVFCAGLLDLML